MNPTMKSFPSFRQTHDLDFSFICRTTLTLLLVFVCHVVLAYDFTVNGLAYNFINGQDTLVEVVAGDNLYTGDIEIQKNITYNDKSYTVSRIGNYAFAGCPSLSSISLPEGLTSIGEGCFSGCVSLNTINIPDSVKEIGARGFAACTQLSNIKLSSSLEIIGDYCFSGCISIETITLPNKVTQLGEYCFSGCNQLSSIIIPSSIIRIGQYCFNNCIALQSLDLTSSITTLPEGFIQGCRGLKELNIPESVTYLGSKCFTGCYIEDLFIPKSVTYISGDFLDRNEHIKSITIDANITSIPTISDRYQNRIRVGCFYECAALESVIIKTPLNNLPDYCFKECTALKEVTLPNSITAFGKGCFINCLSLKDFTIPETIQTIGGACFLGCISLKAIKIPNGVKELPCSEVYFYGYKYDVDNKKYIKENSYVGEVGCFRGCDSLESVYIPSSVTKIGDGTFQNCYSLRTIEIPYGITSLGNFLFCNCLNLDTINIPTSITSFGDDCFYRCENLKSINIPYSITSIGSNCFSGCTSLPSIVIPPSINELKGGTFSACYSLEEIEIPTTVSTIGEGCFSSCISLKHIKIPSSVINIGGACFACCESLDSIIIPESITELPSGSYDFFWDQNGTGPMVLASTWGGFFYKCTSLTSITLPSTLLSIGDECFKECCSLMKITCNAVNVPQTGSKVFDGTPYNTTGCLIVPKSSIISYKEADQWNGWKNICAIGEEVIEIKQCDKPTVKYIDGRIVFTSETPGALFHYTLFDNDIVTTETPSTGAVDISATYLITVYATCDGYTKSEQTIATLCWIDSDSDNNENEDNVSYIKSKAILIQNEGGNITIEGIALGANIVVYSSGGQSLINTIATDNSITLATSLTKGDIIIINLGEKAIKYILH